jgi:hypothetical protein
MEYRGGVAALRGEKKKIDEGEGTSKTVAALRRKDRGNKEVLIHIMSYSNLIQPTAENK